MRLEGVEGGREGASRRVSTRPESFVLLLEREEGRLRACIDVPGVPRHHIVVDTL